jgi:predicted transposase YbfD/YdcC
LPDPRQRQPQHPLLNLLFIASAAQLCGAEGWEARVSFARAKRPWLESVLDLSAGVPSADTLRRVVAALEPQAFAACCRSWGGALAGALTGQVGALEGKALKGALGTASRATPRSLLHGWATEQRLRLGPRAPKGAPGESPGAATLLKLVALEGAIVTGDANFCTQRAARAVRARGAESLLALKGNRGAVHTHVRPFWQAAAATDFAHVRGRQVRRVNPGQGRGEERRSSGVAASARPPLVQRWPDVASVVMVERVRHTATRTPRKCHSYLSSLPPKAQVLHRAARQHGRIESDFQWSLAVSFGDARCRLRDPRAAENLGLVRRMALQLLKRASTGSGGLPIRRLRAGWDTAYLVQVLATGLS